jgi:hypothetical protein
MKPKSFLDRVVNGRLWWALVTLVYLTLIYTTSLHYVTGPGRTINLTYFTDEPRDPLQAERFPDMGAAAGTGIDLTDENGWVLSSVHGDAAVYLIQAETFRPAYPPYCFRMFGPYLAGLLHLATGLSLPLTFALINGLAVLGAALLFTAYLERFHGFSRLVAFLGGVLFVTSTGVVRTLAFPLVDCLSYLWIIIAFWTVRARRPVLFGLAAVAGVWTKPVLAICGLLWLVFHWPKKNPPPGTAVRSWLTAVLPALVPVLAFFAFRLIYGGRVDLVQGGFRLFEGEMPGGFARLLYWGGIARTVWQFFFAFGFLWLGLFNLGRDRFLRIALFTVAIPVAVSVILFSARLIRPLGVIYPVIIPLFLHFFSRFGRVDAAESPGAAQEAR